MEVGHLDRFLQVILVHGFAGVFFDLHQDILAFGSVALHDGEFIVGELARLVQNQVGYRNLSDVVERCGTLQLFDVFVGENILEFAFGLEFPCNGIYVVGRFLDVVSGAGIAGFHHFGEVLDNFVLHAGDAFGLLLQLLDVIQGFVAHLEEGRVQVLDFVLGMNIQGAEDF